MNLSRTSRILPQTTKPFAGGVDERVVRELRTSQFFPNDVALRATRTGKNRTFRQIRHRLKDPMVRIRSLLHRQSHFFQR